MSAKDDLLLETARQICDAKDVDWSKLEGLVNDAELIANLKAVASVTLLCDHESKRTPSPLVQKWTHLELQERIGKGGFGEVYRAWDPRLERDVALKLLLPRDKTSPDQLRGRILREGRLLARIRHLNVAAVHGVAEADGRIGLWMEFVHGRTLKELVARQGTFSAKEAAAIGIDLCRALAAVHNLGLIHRDVKAENVIREEGGRIVLADFGLGTGLPDPPGSQTGKTAGTPLYMAPELFRGENPSVQTDIYALGVLLFYLLTRTYPVRGPGLEKIMVSHANHDRQLLRDLRPDLSYSFVSLVEKCIALDPSNRFRSVGEVELQLSVAGGLNSVREALAELSAIREGGGSRTEEVKPPQGSLAVLPFCNMSPGLDAECFSDGITEEVIGQVSKITSLKVISRTSVMRYKNSEKDLMTIGKELGVAHVLEGSVRQAGSRVRISVRLIETGNEELIWEEDFDRDLADILSVQSEVTKKIAEELQGQLPLAVRPNLTKRNVAAYQAYLRGRYFLNKLSQEGIRKGIRYFRKSLDEDPLFALAYAGLSKCYASSAHFSYLPKHEAFPKARSAASQAIKLDDHLAEAHTSAALVALLYDWDWKLAEKEFRTAIAINRNEVEAHLFYSWHLISRGRLDEAEVECRTAVDVDPLSTFANTCLGYVFTMSGRYDEAIDQLGVVLELDPADVHAPYLIACSLVGKNDYEKAMQYVDSYDLIRHALPVVGWVHALAGDLKAAREIAVQLKDGDSSGVSLAISAALFFLLDEVEEGCRWIEKAYQEHDSQLITLKVNPIFFKHPSCPQLVECLEKLGF